MGELEDEAVESPEHERVGESVSCRRRRLASFLGVVGDKVAEEGGRGKSRDMPSRIRVTESSSAGSGSSTDFDMSSSSEARSTASSSNAGIPAQPTGRCLLTRLDACPNDTDAPVLSGGE